VRDQKDSHRRQTLLRKRYDHPDADFATVENCKVSAVFMQLIHGELAGLLWKVMRQSSGLARKPPMSTFRLWVGTELTLRDSRVTGESV
jgi:hypothetical protein